MSGHVAAIWMHERTGNWNAGCTTGNCRWNVLNLPNRGEAREQALDHMDATTPPDCSCFIENNRGKTEYTGTCKANHAEDVTA